MSTGWAVAGCGWVARDHALPGLAAVPDARVLALHDRDPAAMDRLDVTARRCTDLDDFLATPGLEAVYVATPNAGHLPLVAAAAGAGLAVLCEKPLAADVADAEAMLAACEAAGVLLGTAYDQRFHPAHAALRELLPELGTITAVRIVYCCWLPADWSPEGPDADGGGYDNWRVDPARAGGGAAIDLAPHGLDLVGTILGEDVAALHAHLQRRVQDYPVDDGAMLHGSTPSGVLVSMHVAYNVPDALPRRRLEIVGTKGMAVATDTMGQTAGGSLTLLELDTLPDPGTPLDLGARAIPFDADLDPFTAQLAAFTDAVAGRAPWPHPARRDLALHRLLLNTLKEAGA